MGASVEAAGGGGPGVAAWGPSGRGARRWSVGGPGGGVSAGQHGQRVAVQLTGVQSRSPMKERLQAPSVTLTPHPLPTRLCGRAGQDQEAAWLHANFSAAWRAYGWLPEAFGADLASVNPEVRRGVRGGGGGPGKGRQAGERQGDCVRPSWLMPAAPPLPMAATPPPPSQCLLPPPPNCLLPLTPSPARTTECRLQPAPRACGEHLPAARVHGSARAARPGGRHPARHQRHARALRLCGHQRRHHRCTAGAAPDGR